MDQNENTSCKGSSVTPSISPLEDNEVRAEHGSQSTTSLVFTESSSFRDEAITKTSNLRRVPGRIPWTAYSITFVETLERLSYFGTAAVYVNFIHQPLPPSSPTGAGFTGQSGALGLGQRTSTALTALNGFWTFFMPVIGAYIADEHLGRFRTIKYGMCVALLGHTILVISAIPAVIAFPRVSLAFFLLGMLVLGVGTGGFKANIPPLVAEQITDTTTKVHVTKTGERVLIDPAATMTKLFLHFYLCTNIGSLVGQVSMAFAEKYVGFWLSFLLPTIVFGLCPMILFTCRHKYRYTPPTGSVTANAFRLWRMAMKPHWSWNLAKMRRSARATGFWDKVKPSNQDLKPNWMTFDDSWVEEVQRGLKACLVFLWLPIFWLCYAQTGNNLISQASTLQLNGIPNDVIANLNPITLIILLPLLDKFLYPFLRDHNIRFSPLKRIRFGFFIASLAMLSAAVLQHYIYKLGPCGSHPNRCMHEQKAHSQPAPISVWFQAIPYMLIAASEALAGTSALEYAYTRAPKNMKSLAVGINIMMMAVASLLRQILVPLAEDPWLVWNYGVIGVLAFLAGLSFWTCMRGLDRDEDQVDLEEKVQECPQP